MPWRTQRVSNYPMAFHRRYYRKKLIARRRTNKTRALVPYTRTGGNRRTLALSSSGRQRGMMRRRNPIPRRPLGTYPFAKLVMKSNQMFHLSANASNVGRVVVAINATTSNVSPQEYTMQRNFAARYREIRYVGSTVAVNNVSNHFNVAQPGATSTPWDWEQITQTLQWTLGYKHETGDIVNPSWPMGMKDTHRLKTGKGSFKKFFLPKNLIQSHWAEVNDMIPATQPTNYGPVTWANIQYNGSNAPTQGSLESDDVNDFINVAYDQLPRMLDPSGIAAQWFTGNFRVRWYHHFELRNPNQVGQ